MRETQTPKKLVNLIAEGIAMNQRFVHPTKVASQKRS
jgi:hypothetical protein